MSIRKSVTPVAVSGTLVVGSTIIVEARFGQSCLHEPSAHDVLAGKDLPRSQVSERLY